MKAGSALTLDLNRVNSTLVYKQSMLVADILCIKLGKEKDIIIYSDMGYDVNKHTLVRQEWGVLKSFSSPNAYCKGIIGIGYDGKINMIKPYLLLHI